MIDFVYPILFRALASIMFLLTFIISLKICGSRQKNQEIWKSIALIAFVAFFESIANVFEWLEISPGFFDQLGEYLDLILFLIFFNFSVIVLKLKAKGVR